MTTLTASEARAGLYRLIDQAAESHKPVIISGKRANAVLISEEDWSAIQETLYLLSIPAVACVRVLQLYGYCVLREWRVLRRSRARARSTERKRH